MVALGKAAPPAPLVLVNADGSGPGSIRWSIADACFEFGDAVMRGLCNLALPR